ncbi:SAM-dependent DNA methyltransferase [Spirochaeta isovalerica]|uniref:Site-specific DNA-methyltransferase (adenine-specific) n=1 Tax=Spirochaeta isovalerica TaxID=150 RepID=A0A841R6J4_9SPIO|nr:SAM-dependent DNA methyltransferase [Spirochaeta isovalerica]MBB6480824.1 hypothetical protein [Spirochaeta isovalerica]
MVSGERILSELEPIGAVFTPLLHAQKTIIDTGLYENWLHGASILDPTAGGGHFIEAFIKTAKEKGDRLTDQRLSRLCAVEMQSRFIEDFHRKMKREYKVDFPGDRFLQGDYLFTHHREEFDFLLGNPPWLNFCDLENGYKEKIKPLFIDSGLTGSKKDLLLGSSRIDLAALIVTEAIRKNLKTQGTAYFFLPLSLFLGEGAHKQFRFLLETGAFSLNYIDDYRDAPLFPGVATRYGFASFTKDRRTTYPVPYRRIRPNGTFRELNAAPLAGSGSPLIAGGMDDLKELPRIFIPPKSKPRQGLNTCGANSLFIFDEITGRNKNILTLKNKEREATLPEELIYPLIGSGQFNAKKHHRYVFLPYNLNGRALSETELAHYPEAECYLRENRSRLENRKGVLIGSAIKKGLWWSLLGVGPYSFAPWKVVWEAYGKREFHPRLFSSENKQPWQPNQALQAFIPFNEEREAKRVLKEMENSPIGEILKMQGMEGTCNWAQPGKMIRFFSFKDEI